MSTENLAISISTSNQRKAVAVDRLRINISWLLALRWAAVAGQLLTVVAVWWGLGIDLPIVALLIIIGITAVTNGAFILWFRWLEKESRWQDWAQTGYWFVDAVITLDILLLSALLYFTGGALNPFSIFFLVNLALAAVVVQSQWIWVIGCLSIVCVAVLFRWHHPLKVLEGELEMKGVTGLVSARSEGHFVAFSAAAAAIAYFIARLERELVQRDEELGLIRQREARRERLESLATLAAGAAHELATPLSTIAVVAKELERHLEVKNADAEAIDDARLIRSELTHCRTILDRMAGRAGESVGEGMSRMTLREVVDEMLSGLPKVERVHVEPLEDTERTLTLPRVAIAQSLRGILKNALDAAGDGGHVRLVGEWKGNGIRIEVDDNGPGMDPAVLERAGEPFFTTKEPGKGMGLGLFLARAVFDRLGGRFDIRTSAGKGTKVVIFLPAMPATMKADRIPSAV